MPPEKSSLTKVVGVQREQTRMDAQRRLSSAPTATEICDQMSLLRSTGTKESSRILDYLLTNNLSTKENKGKRFGKSSRSKAESIQNLELYKSSSYVLVKPYTRCAVRRSDVKMTPLKFHKVLSTPIQVTALDSIKVISNVRGSKSAKFCFCLEADLVNRILKSKNSNSNAIKVFLRFCNNDKSQVQDDVIPYCIVKVNKRVALFQVKDKFCGPLDITRLCCFNEGKESKDFLHVQWMPSLRKGYCLTVCVAEKLPIEEKVLNLMERGVKDQSITKEMVERKFEFDKDVRCTSLKASLICPLGKTRLQSPCRGSNCTHIQCMDAFTLLKMNEKHPTSEKKCYMCDEKLGDIYIDGLFIKILSTVPQGIDEVEFLQDGSWIYEMPNNFSSATKKSCSGKSEKKLEEVQNKDKTGVIKIEIDNESESDKFNAMDISLSRLSSHLDHLDRFTKWNEKYNEIRICDDTDIESNRNSGSEQRIQKDGIGFAAGNANSTDDIDEATNKQKEKDIDQRKCEDEIIVISVDDECVEVLGDDKDRIKRLRKEEELNDETERRIENMITEMLKKVKKTKKKRKRKKKLQKKKDDDLTSVNNDSQLKVQAVDKDIQSTREKDDEVLGNTSPCIALKPNDDRGDAVDVADKDIDMETITKNANDYYSSVYKTDGTLADDVIIDGPSVYDDKTNLINISHFGSPVIEHVDMIGHDLHHCKSSEDDKLDEEKRDLIEEKRHNDDCNKDKPEIDVEINARSCIEKLKDNDNIETNKTNVHSISVDTSGVLRSIRKHLWKDQLKKSIYHKSDECLNTSEPNCSKNLKLSSTQTKTPKLKQTSVEVLNQSNKHVVKKYTVDPTLKDKSGKVDSKDSEVRRGKEISYTGTRVKLGTCSSKESRPNKSLSPTIKKKEEKERCSPLQQSVGRGMLPTKCKSVSIESGKRKSVEDSASRQQRIPKKQKLIIDDYMEISEVDMQNELLLHTYHYYQTKQKMDIAPSTKNLMKIAETGIGRRIKFNSNGQIVDDFFKTPSIPFKSKKLKKFYQSYFSK